MERLAELLLRITEILLSAYLVGALLVAVVLVGGFAVVWCALQ
jgi:hypothetical protein